MEGNRSDRIVSITLGAIAGFSVGISILDILGILPGWASKLTPFFVGVLLLYVVLERERVESLKYIVRRLDKGVDRLRDSIARGEPAPATEGVAAPMPGKPDTYRAIPWKGMVFHSKTELRVAKALDHAGVVFLPPAKMRLTSGSERQSREIDFLVLYEGRWGVLEVDGPWHTQTGDTSRDELLRANGVTCIRRYDSERAYHETAAIVSEFLAFLTNCKPAAVASR
ncbi:MAG TPA: hypothetical protein VER79_01235 [Candidatus Limnocylindrales bacterium]|nr:hypothetical protein [Candidatus Limnocylindrales bacterium]